MSVSKNVKSLGKQTTVFYLSEFVFNKPFKIYLNKFLDDMSFKEDYVRLRRESLS